MHSFSYKLRNYQVDVLLNEKELGLVKDTLDKFYLKSNLNCSICAEICTIDLKLNTYKQLYKSKPFAQILMKIGQFKSDFK